MIAAGSPWPPGTDGKGKNPRSGSGLLFGVREAITPGSQAPISSMLALWLATRPAELPAPCWAEVVRKPSLNGFVSAKALRSSPAFVQQGSLKFLSLAAASRVALLHARRAKK